VQVKIEQEVGATTARIAYQIAQNIDNNPREQANVLAVIAAVLAKAGKGEEAEALFDSAGKTAQKINSQQERVDSFTVIAEAQARVKEFSAAFKTAQRIEFPSIKAQVLGVIAKAQAEAGQAEESQKTLNSVVEMAEELYLEGEGINVLIAIAEAQAAREKEVGLATLSNLLETVRESRERSKYLSKIAVAYVNLEQIPTALMIADEIEDESESVKALSWIAWGQFNKGEKEEVLTTLTAALEAKDKIEDEQKRVQALRGIAGIQAMAGKGEEAVRTAETILTERNLYLPGIASWLIETGEQVNFKKLLIPCAYYLDAAYQMCGYLARLYPEKTEEIAKVVSDFN
jgi:tetratricopeptide (TPR) repeat protein